MILQVSSCSKTKLHSVLMVEPGGGGLQVADVSDVVQSKGTRTVCLQPVKCGDQVRRGRRTLWMKSLLATDNVCLLIFLQTASTTTIPLMVIAVIQEIIHQDCCSPYWQYLSLCKNEILFIYFLYPFYIWIHSTQSCKPSFLFKVLLQSNLQFFFVFLKLNVWPSLCSLIYLESEPRGLFSQTSLKVSLKCLCAP